MTTVDPLDRPGLAPLWAELARRFGDGPAPAAITLRDLSATERQALADLLGLDRLPKATIRLTVSRLAAACGEPDSAGLHDLVERRMGPVTDRREARLEKLRAREAFWAWFEASVSGLPLASHEPALVEPWLQAVRSAGIPGGDLDGHRQRLSRALGVIAALPADGMGLSSLAADVLGDAHGLDRGRGTATLVLDAVAATQGRARASDAEAARLLWEEVGVVPDPLSSTVLSLGIRPRDPGANPLSDWLQATAGAGEPAVLTLAQLRRWPLDSLGADEVAYVVENPGLLNEAAAGGWSGPPLVCSSGRPSIAVVTMLRQLGAAGATLFQHADFDRGGLGITAWLAGRAGTTPWQMDAVAYRAALTVARDRPAITGPIPPSPWDPELREAMAEAGVAVHEEEIRADLLPAMAR